METDVAIIGGGLAGLAVAHGLSDSSRRWCLLEARDRLGGRVLSHPDPRGAASFDLGPAWIWPDNQSMLALARHLGMRVVPQYASGRLVYEESDGTVRRDLDFSTMAGALRVDGGLARMIDALAASLPTAHLHLGHVVCAIAHGGSRFIVTGQANGAAFTVEARQIVLALPPRVIAESIALPPEYGDRIRGTLAAIPTWMAGHAKVVAVYDTPFWRAARMSGDGISRRGPLMEIHDASPDDGRVGALFGFVGVPPAHRRGQRDALLAAAKEQLVRLYGPEASSPRAFLFHDWAEDPETSVAADHALPARHPAYGMPRELAELRHQGLVFAGTEVAETYGGFLEGALEAATAAVQALRETARETPAVP